MRSLKNTIYLLPILSLVGCATMLVPKTIKMPGYVSEKAHLEMENHRIKLTITQALFAANGPLVQIKTRITNKSSKEYVFEYADLEMVDVGSGVTYNNQFAGGGEMTINPGKTILLPDVFFVTESAKAPKRVRFGYQEMSKEAELQKLEIVNPVHETLSQ